MTTAEATPEKADGAQAEGRPIAAPRPLAAVVLVGVIALVAGLLGPAWVFSPAQPALKMPAMQLAFNDMRAMTTLPISHSPAFQQAYFGWMAWTMVVVSVLVAIASAVVTLAARALHAAVAVLGVAGVVCTVYGVKGAMSWSQVVDQLPNMRLGAYLVLGGFLLLLGHGTFRLVRRPPATE